MKKFMKSIQMMAALLLAVAATTACTNDDNATAEKAPVTADAPKTYTLTVTASKGGEATTRALSIARTGALNATWTKDDEVKVQEYLKDGGSGISRVPTEYGTLTATNVSADGLSCTLAGVITGKFINGQELTLIYNGGSAGPDGTKGTLNYVAKNDDQSTAVVSITGEPANSDVSQTLETTPATFENQQAILRFTLKGLDGATLISPTALNVKRKGGGARTLKDIPADTYADNGEGVLYTAFPGGSGTIVLDATLADGSHCYYQKTDVTLENGKYYTISVKMKKGTVDLSALTADYTAVNGDTLYGTLPQNIKLSIASGAEVTLNGVTTQEGTIAAIYPGIECKGSATINLIGTNQVVGYFGGAGIFVPEGNTLTIQGVGSLTATGDGGAAGIGCGQVTNCGHITIKGGNILAIGGDGGAGIGSALYASCGDITITDGTVTATGGYQAAGIGSCNLCKCGNITISGGTVSATGGEYAAGIGSGEEGSCGSITITKKVTSVTAVKGSDPVSQFSIGPGHSGTCGKVKIGDKTYDAGNGVRVSPYTYAP